MPTLALLLCSACGDDGAEPSLSADGLEHKQRIEFEGRIGFETPSGVNGINAIAMAAGDSTLVTTLARHRESYVDSTTGNEVTEEGALAVFELQSEQWIETAFLTHPNPDSDALGYYVATDDRTIFASIGGRPELGILPRGLAVFEKRTGEWTLTQTLEDVACVVGVDVDGDVAVVGDHCPEPDSPEGEVAVGRAHVFRRSEGRWTKAQELRTSVTDTANRMGTHYWGTPIAINGGTVVMGVPFYSEPGTEIYFSGAVFVFWSSGESFREIRVIKPESPQWDGEFGDSVDIDGNRIAIAAVGEDDYKGLVYVHAREHNWERVSRLSPENTRGLHGFGWSIALRGLRLIVGTPSERGQQRGVNEFDLIAWEGAPYGAAYVFEEDPLDHRWRETYYLKDARPPDWGDGFGAGVALTESQAIVGGSGRVIPGYVHVWTFD